MARDDVSKDPKPGRPARAGVKNRGVMVDAMPSSDPAYPIVHEILKVVPASRWAFARLGQSGDLERYLSSGANGGLGKLATELKRQRIGVKKGPRIGAALGSMADFESGITLLFADARATFGILTLLRSAELGPFTSAEVSILTLALAATSDRLSLLRLHPEDVSVPALEIQRGRGEARVDGSDGSFYVLDRDMQIVLAWDSENRRRIAMTGLRTRIADRLPALLEATVRELTSAWGDAGESHDAGRARPVPFLVVHTAPMSGPSGLFIGVRIDRSQPPNALSGAAERFHISPRELQVLALLLDGEHLAEIGSLLHITSSTVQDHIRSMVEKTGSRNRTDLIARIFGWESAPDHT